MNVKHTSRCWGLGALAAFAFACGTVQSDADDAPLCGDGMRDVGEACDDGNVVAGDGCSPRCTVEPTSPRCGDGNRDPGEACDDGNTADADGCSSDCRSNETCGNGVVDNAVGELCDDGNTMAGDGCASTCLSTCGNGVVEADHGEICDDGNIAHGDGCSGLCQPEPRVSAGGHFSCAIITSGDVKCWGANHLGQLGLGDAEPRGDGPGEMGTALPAVNLGTGARAKALASGWEHTCALLVDGSVKCWGNNTFGQLGRGDTVRIGDNSQEMGDALVPVDLGTGRTATALATGRWHSCALLDSGAVKCWGSGDQGQLGLGNTERRGDRGGQMGDSLPAVPLGSGRTAAQISLGAEHSCALLDDATVKCWGKNIDGALGQGHTAAIGDGPNELGDALGVVDLGPGRTAVQIAAGGYHTCALLDNSAIKCWGFNGFGQLGLGHALKIGDEPGEMGAALAELSLGPSRLPARIYAGTYYTCVLFTNGSLACFGRNTSGQLGLGDAEHRGDNASEMGSGLQMTSLGTGHFPVAVASGEHHNCAVLDDDDIKCWGSNSSGELGLGDTIARGDAAGQMGDALPAVPLTD